MLRVVAAPSGRLGRGSFFWVGAGVVVGAEASDFLAPVAVVISQISLVPVGESSWYQNDVPCGFQCGCTRSRKTRPAVDAGSWAARS